MKICVTSTNNSADAALDPRFGRASWFAVWQNNTWQFIDNSMATQVDHGAGPRAVQAIIDAGVNVVITGNGPGGNASTALKAAGIKVFLCAPTNTIEQAINLYNNNELTEF